MSDKIEQIDEKLSQIIRLLALQVVQSKNKTDSILMLALAGLDRNVIAELVHTTPLTVSVTLSDARKKKRKKKPKTSSDEN